MSSYSVVFLLSFSFVNNRMHGSIRVVSLLLITFVNATAYDVESTVLITFTSNRINCSANCHICAAH
jgi:hypothetical protein